MWCHGSWRLPGCEDVLLKVDPSIWKHMIYRALLHHAILVMNFSCWFVLIFHKCCYIDVLFFLFFLSHFLRLNRCMPTPQSWQLLSVTQYVWQRIVSVNLCLQTAYKSIPLETEVQFFIALTANTLDTLEKDGKVGVLNSERLRTPTGEGKNITGYAYIPDPNQPGKLKVHLGGVPVDAPCKCLSIRSCQAKQVTCHFYTTGLTWEGTILTIMLCNRTKFPCPRFSLVFSLLYFVDDGHSPSLPAENHVTHPESHVLPQKIFRHSPISWQ